MENKIKDDMLFEPYMQDGYQCKIQTILGVISVRYGGVGLITDKDRPYEVCYPQQGSTTGYQTADDIFNYIKIISKWEKINSF